MQTPIEAISVAGPPTGPYAPGSAVLDSNSYLWVNPGGSFVEVQTPGAAPSSPNAGRAYIENSVSLGTTLLIDTWVEDWVSGDITIASAGITIESDGLYYVVANLGIAYSTEGTAGGIYLTVNGTSMRYYSYYNPELSTLLTVAFSDIIRLNASDVLSIQCDSPSGSDGTLYGGIDNSWLSVFQVVGA